MFQQYGYIKKMYLEKQICTKSFRVEHVMRKQTFMFQLRKDKTQTFHHYTIVTCLNIIIPSPYDFSTIVHAKAILTNLHNYSPITLYGGPQ